jgi:hypothetical protein
MQIKIFEELLIKKKSNNKTKIYLTFIFLDLSHEQTHERTSDCCKLILGMSSF